MCYSKEDIKRAELVQDYWVNFGKKGNRNGDKLPEWPLHKNRNGMKFTTNTGENSETIKDVREEKLDAFEEGLLLLLAKLEKTHTVGK